MNNDLISREALKKKLSDANYQTYTHEYGYAIPTECVMNAIDNAPTVEAYTGTDLIEENKNGFNTAKRLYERPQGKWAEIEGGYICSNCEDIEAYTPNFCPNCGADMRKGDKE